jgi:anti-sigma factor ChrR (cupin superfamily)
MNAMADEDIEALHALLPSVSSSQATAAPDPIVKQQLLDLADAPALPIDVSRYAWFDAVPGIKLAVLKEDPSRGLRACLAWGKAGARHPRHRHGGDELILVLEGVLRDERGEYGPGAVCHSRTGDVHSEEVVEDCLCYVLYFGELEMLEG